MKPATRQLLADLKTAALLGDPDSLSTVFDSVRNLPDADLPPASLGPLGAALARLPVELLAPWLTDSDPGVRGIAAGALGTAFAEDRQVPFELLAAAADDPSEEVRAGFILQAAADPSRAAGLIEGLLQEKDPRPVESGLRLLARTGAHTETIRAGLAGLDAAEDYGVRSALVDALAALAESGQADRVLDLLGDWATRGEPNVWVITRAASSSWAHAHTDAVQAVLERLADQVGRIRPVLRAFERLADQKPL